MSWGSKEIDKYIDLFKKYNIIINNYVNKKNEYLNFTYERNYGFDFK